MHAATCEFLLTCHEFILHTLVAESALVVGLEETAYTVDEVDSYQLVCVGVLSGDVDGREISLSYCTTSGTACKYNL